MTRTNVAEIATSKPIAAGLLIVATSALFAVCPWIVWSATGVSVYGFSALPLNILLQVYAAYLFTAIPAILGGFLAWIGIRKFGWIGITHWLAVTALLVLVWIPPWISALDFRSELQSLFFIFMLVASTFLASLATRFLIIALGWMRKQ